jgi:hypothetical protein
VVAEALLPTVSTTGGFQKPRIPRNDVGVRKSSNGVQWSLGICGVSGYLGGVPAFSMGGALAEHATLSAKWSGCVSDPQIQGC